MSADACVCVHIHTWVFKFLSLMSLSATLPPSIPWDVAHEKTDGIVGQFPGRHFLPRCHLSGIASVLIRGSTDATLHLRTVTQPESSDADEEDDGNRRLEMPHLPPLLYFFFSSEERSRLQHIVERESKHRK